MFIPPNSREISQFILIKPELEKLGGEFVIISLDEKIEPLLKHANLRFKRFKDYNTLNVLNILNYEKPDIVITNPIGALPVPYSFAIAANYNNIPCLQIYNGVLAYSNLKSPKVIFGKPFLLLIVRIARMISDTEIMRSIFILWLTIKATSTRRQFLKRMTRDTIRFALPIGRSSQYVEGTSIAVYSNAAKELFINTGFPPEMIIVTGQPRLDEIYNRKYNKDTCYTDLNITRNKEIVVLATQPLKIFWNQKDRKKFLKTILDAMDSFPELQLVIKIHPEENIVDYHNLLTEIGYPNTVIYQDYNLYDLLHACSLLITTHSTTAMEAILFGKPVLCVDFTGRCHISFYTDDGAAIGIRHQDDLIPAINKSLYDPQTKEDMKHGRERFISHNIYKPDGQTAKRIAESIIQLVQSSNVKTT